MKRNKKHTNVVQEKAPETNSLIMTDGDGKMVKASGIQLVKDFANIADKIAQAKGGKLDDATKSLLEMTEIWTPDMVGEPAAVEENQKAAVAAEEKPKAKRTRKPKAVDVEEKPKKVTRKKKEDAPVEEKPKKKATRKKKTEE